MLSLDRVPQSHVNHHARIYSRYPRNLSCSLTWDFASTLILKMIRNKCHDSYYITVHVLGDFNHVEIKFALSKLLYVTLINVVGKHFENKLPCIVNVCFLCFCVVLRNYGVCKVKGILCDFFIFNLEQISVLINPNLYKC